MDQDSGQRAAQWMPERQGPAEARHARGSDPGQAAADPLPRRAAQRHMAPQLRRHTEAAAGNAAAGDMFPDNVFADDVFAGFAAFGAVTPDIGPASTAPPNTGSPDARPVPPDPLRRPTIEDGDSSSVAEFREGTRRGRPSGARPRQSEAPR